MHNLINTYTRLIFKDLIFFVFHIFCKKISIKNTKGNKSEVKTLFIEAFDHYFIFKANFSHLSILSLTFSGPHKLLEVVA